MRSVCRGQRSIASSTRSSVTTSSAGRTRDSIVSVPDCFAWRRARSAIRRATISRRSPRPFLRSLSAETGEGSKISVIDGEGLLVVAAAPGAREYALTVIPGQRLPLHAGAAGKTLLAHLPKENADRRLAGALQRYTLARSPIRGGSEPSLPASDDKGGRRTGASTPQAFMRSPRRSSITMRRSLPRLAYRSSRALRGTIWTSCAPPSSQPPRRFPERCRPRSERGCRQPRHPQNGVPESFSRQALGQPRGGGPSQGESSVALAADRHPLYAGRG